MGYTNANTQLNLKLMRFVKNNGGGGLIVL